ncbi:hypothetical protein [Paenibacillus fonticola]|uniref:hypothetical protein n=1 Tax=Paenibacillus fonticola TaxID=379896 RepID=UPI0003776FEA|nr:hypothetical protein [Paenibacillus fonticola]
MKKLMTVLLAGAFVFSSVPFVGVGAARADNSVTEKESNGHITLSFLDVKPNQWAKPDQFIKRNEFVSMVVNALNLPIEPIEGKGYEPVVQAAHDYSLYTGTEFKNTELEWNKNITRKEVAQIAVRATGQTTTESDKWMYLATKAGLITGLGKGELGETLETTRAQAVKIIERILTVKNGGTLPVDKYAVSSAEIAWHGTNIFTVMPEIFVHDESLLKGKEVAELWKEEKMTIDSIDGKYRGRLNALIAIDMEDPNDPNWKLLPPVDKLKWNSHDVEKINKVTDWPNSYLLIFDGEEVYNKDTKAYGKRGYVPFIIHGIDSPDMRKFFQGELNKIAGVHYERSGDLPVVIVPKKGWTTDGISISLQTPSYSNYAFKSQSVLEITGSRK